MKLFLLLQFLLCILGGGLIYLFNGSDGAASYLSGSFLIFLNVVSLATAWSLISRKKLVAVSVSIIVFKYAILGVIIYRLLKMPWLNPVWMSVGLSSLMVTTLLFGLLQGLNNQKEE